MHALSKGPIEHAEHKELCTEPTHPELMGMLSVSNLNSYAHCAKGAWVPQKLKYLINILSPKSPTHIDFME
jgi:hypothetical protein